MTGSKKTLTSRTKRRRHLRRLTIHLTWPVANSLYGMRMVRLKVVPESLSSRGPPPSAAPPGAAFKEQRPSGERAPPSALLVRQSVASPLDACRRPQFSSICALPHSLSQRQPMTQDG